MQALTRRIHNQIEELREFEREAARYQPLSPPPRRRVNDFQRLVAEAGVVQPGVVAALRQQRIMRALFTDLALAQHDDAVGVADSRLTIVPGCGLIVVKGDYNAIFNFIPTQKAATCQG